MAKQKSQRKHRPAWIDELQTYVESTKIEDINYGSLPESVKNAYEDFCGKADYDLPGIEIGILIAAMLAKMNGVDSLDEDKLLIISPIITAVLGVQSVADIVGIEELRKDPPGDSLSDHLRQWLDEIKHAPQ